MQVWWIFVGVYAELYFISHRFFGTAEQLLSCAAFWLSILLTPMVALLPDFVAS